MSLSKETIAAYADGELEGDALQEAEAVIAADPALLAQVSAHRAFKGRLSAHFAPIAEMPVPGHLIRAVKGSTEDNVVDFAAAARKPPRPASPRFRWTGPALAASLVVALVGYGVSQRSAHDYAEGDVALALDRQLVVSQPADAPVRILLSFRDGEGRFCRGFSSRAQAGIACRDGRGWKLDKVLGGQGSATGEYRQAGAEPQIMAAIQDRAQGQALDAEEESAAARAGWRRR